MAAYGYRHVPSSQIDRIVGRLTRPTRASQTWKHDYDAQQAHVEHLRLIDPFFHPKRTVTPQQLDPIIKRLRKSTRASTASTYNFDHQEANLMHLYAKDPKIKIGGSSRASSATGSGSNDSSLTGSENGESMLSLGKSRKSAGGRSVASSDTVSSQQLRLLVDRLTKPTVASRGGIDYADRKWEYIPTPKLKTLPNIPGLETRYKCKNKTMTQEEFDKMVVKLTKPTKASKWKAAPNAH